MYDEILDNGFIKTKDNYIKIIEVFPINFNFKSENEKHIILENYKNFFKNIKVDIQIYIFSQKEDLRNYFNLIKTKTPKENEIKEEYKNYLQNLIETNNFYYKRFFIVISQRSENIILKELENKILNVINMFNRINELKIISDKNEILEILNFIYK